MKYQDSNQRQHHVTAATAGQSYALWDKHNPCVLRVGCFEVLIFQAVQLLKQVHLTG